MSEVTDIGKTSEAEGNSNHPNKNIIICSDGTGNSGGIGPETNVYRIYRAIDTHNAKRRQLKYYDDGIGTGGNKIWKLLGGAFGLGLDRNIIQAYTFLCRNYVEGDHIYLFGFSRGAYTVRALASFISYCGVLKGIKKSNATGDRVTAVDQLDAERLAYEIDYLVELYMHRLQMEETFDLATPNIAFVGVWDTVSAVGLPFENKIKSLIARSMFKFHFRDFDLSPKVDRACHALAIDDQRKTFHPELWNKDQRIEQVWFSGMHSNVGGGYPKQGMAHVSLCWMISKVKSENGEGSDGLLFFESSVTGFEEDADPLGKMHDSRAGLAAYYRFEPRFFHQMESLDEINVDFSVIERIANQTGGYNPGNFALRLVGGEPQKLTVVNTPGDRGAKHLAAKVEGDIGTISSTLKTKYAETISFRQEALHLAFLQFSLLLLIAFLSGYIALNTEGLSPPEITACIKKWAAGLSLVYVGTMAITFAYTQNWIKRALCVLTSLLPFGVIYLIPDEAAILQGINGVLETVLGVMSWIVAVILPDFLMEPVNYFITNSTAVASIAVLIFGILMFIRQKLSREAKRVVFDSWKGVRQVVPD